MTNRMKRLELTWIGKEERPRLEPRILLEDPELSCTRRVSDEDVFDNWLIHGDNLLALKALEQDFAGKVKCVFIDPPYNTGSAFTHYDDGLEHSLWLSLMRDRLEVIHSLLASDGSLWITIDDNESHYLKVLCDEVFGRDCFVANVVWEKVYTPKSNGRVMSSDHDHILVYARTEKFFVHGWNVLPRTDEQIGRFRNPDDDPNGPWRTYPLDVRTENGAKREKYRYAVTLPSGRVIRPSAGRHWALPQERFEAERRAGDIYFGVDGDAMPTRKVYLKDAKQGVLARTWWPYKEVGGNQDAKREILALFGDTGFITPKPERLLERVLTIATNVGDLVLDSFLGSGTTAAVAHKMRRRWIGIELGDHAVSHCVPRLRKVVAGEDSGGITESVGWTGGGGFRFFKLAPSLLEKDKWGNWIVSKQYNPEMLAEAMCKHEGFRYAPDREVFWNHGYSTERDFIYVTTQNLSLVQIRFISEQVGSERTLLICCGAFRGKPDFANVTLKKIPQALLARCEWGRDDYSFDVREQAPIVAVEEAKMDTGSDGTNTRTGGRRKQPMPVQSLPLFAGINEGEK
jgi:adenine-specific DNA-methyltransferase